MTTSFGLSFLLQAAAQPRGAYSFAPIIIQMGAIFAIFYFLMIRPQQKQRKLHEERLRNLRKGDSVVTAGGIVGEVVHIKEAAGEDAKKTMDDHVTIKTGESRVIVQRGRISTVAGPTGTTGPTT